MGLALSSLGGVLATVPLLLAGILADVDRHVKYERTGYTQFKLFGCLSALGITSGIGFGMIKPTNLPSTKLDILTLMVGAIGLGDYVGQ
jgi:hypothetical protein